MSSDSFRYEYCKELDEELKTILQDFRDGNLAVPEMLKLIEASCRDHLDFKMMGSQSGRLHAENK